MNTLFTINDKFVPQLSACICSLCENNKNSKEINIYVISSGIKNENKKKLINLVKKYNRNINIIELGKIEEYFDFEFDTTGWPPITLARLLMDKLLPHDVERIIYIDADTIIRGSLEELWNLDIGDSILGMSIEPTISYERLEKLDLVGNPYCNAGVMLVNLQRWRDEKAINKIFNYYKKHEGKLFANDQDAINGSLKDKIFIISPKYNYYNIYDQYSYKFLNKLMKQSKYIEKSTFDDAKKNPVIIHYLGEERPWREGNTHKYKSDYKKYLGLTDFCNEKDEKGWKLYFLCWRIFNTITKPFPDLRLKIINSLIPKFMNYRSKKIKKEAIKNEK